MQQLVDKLTFDSNDDVKIILCIFFIHIFEICIAQNFLKSSSQFSQVYIFCINIHLCNKTTSPLTSLHFDLNPNFCLFELLSLSSLGNLMGICSLTRGNEEAVAIVPNLAMLNNKVSNSYIYIYINAQHTVAQHSVAQQKLLPTDVYFWSVDTKFKDETSLTIRLKARPSLNVLQQPQAALCLTFCSLYAIQSSLQWMKAWVLLSSKMGASNVGSKITDSLATYSTIWYVTYNWSQKLFFLWGTLFLRKLYLKNFNI